MSFLFVKPTMIKVFLLTCFFLLLYAFKFPYFEVLCTYILIINFLPYKKMKVLPILNLVFWILTGSAMAMVLVKINAVPVIWPSQQDRALLGGINIFFVTVAALTIFALIYYTLFRFFLRQPLLRYPLIFCFFIFCILLFLSRKTESHMWLNVILVGTLFAFGKMFWLICFQLSEVEYLKDKSFFSHLGTLNSPWQVGWASYMIPRGYSDYTNNLVVETKQLMALRWSALKLMLYSLILKFVAYLLYCFCFLPAFKIGTYLVSGLPSYFKIKMTPLAYVNQEMSHFQAWFFVLSWALYFILSMTAATGAIVSIARMCGFAVKRNVYKPYLATSFNNFLQRIYYYYISVLQRFFFYPLWRQFKFIKQRSVRVFLVFFLTIFLGGVVNTFVRYAPELVKTDSGWFYYFTRVRLSYLFSLALLSGVTALLPVISERFENGFTKALRALGYFILYSLCFSLQIGNSSIDISARLRSLVFLFGM